MLTSVMAVGAKAGRLAVRSAEVATTTTTTSIASYQTLWWIICVILLERLFFYCIDKFLSMMCDRCCFWCCGWRRRPEFFSCRFTVTPAVLLLGGAL